MKGKLKGAWETIKQSFSEWREDKAPRLAAAIAFYTIFSLAPLLIIAIAIAGLVFGEEAARGQIMGQISGLVGSAGGRAIEDMVAGAGRRGAGILGAIIGVIILLFGAGGLFDQLQDALNTIWEVKPKPERGIWGVLKDRFLSFGMVLVIGFLLLVSLVLTTALSALSGFIGGPLGEDSFLFHIVNFVISFGVITLLFALMFKVLPDAKIAWSDVWLGAAITALLFEVGKYLLGFYLGRATVASAYGAAGSLVVLLLWVYYASQILLFGAEFTQVYANKYGSGVKPEETAMAVEEKEVPKQEAA